MSLDFAFFVPKRRVSYSRFQIERRNVGQIAESKAKSELRPEMGSDYVAARCEMRLARAGLARAKLERASFDDSSRDSVSRIRAPWQEKDNTQSEEDGSGASPNGGLHAGIIPVRFLSA